MQAVAESGGRAPTASPLAPAKNSLDTSSNELSLIWPVIEGASSYELAYGTK